MSNLIIEGNMGKGGGGKEYKDSLISNQLVKTLFVISEGVIDSVENVFLDTMPISNFDSEWEYRTGLPSQPIINNFITNEAPASFQQVLLTRGTVYKDPVKDSPNIEVGSVMNSTAIKEGKFYKIRSVTDAASFTFLGADSTPAVGEIFKAKYNGTIISSAGTCIQCQGFKPDEFSTNIPADVTKVKLGFTIQVMVYNDPDGNVKGSSAYFLLYTRPSQSSTFTLEGRFGVTGKTTHGYSFDVMLNAPVGVTAGSPWEVKIIRETPDSGTSKKQNQVTWAAVTYQYPHSSTYPNSALVGIQLNDATQFGNKVPEIMFKVKGRKVKIFSNYDSVNKTYTGNWDGNFALATYWTSNPALILLDLLTDYRAGLGIDISDIDKYSFYNLAKYCDEDIHGGYIGAVRTNDDSWAHDFITLTNMTLLAKGYFTCDQHSSLTYGLEVFITNLANTTNIFASINETKTYFIVPDTGTNNFYIVEDLATQEVVNIDRFGAPFPLSLAGASFKITKTTIARYTFDYSFQQRDGIKDVLAQVLSVCNANLITNEFGQVGVVYSHPNQVVKRNVTNANVVDGAFTYQSSGIEQRTNLVNVTYNNKLNFGRTETATVSEDILITRYGLQPLDVVLPGCYYEAQAIRKARHVLYTNCYFTNVISFAVFLDGLTYKIGDLIRVYDNYNQDSQQAGVITSTTTVSGSNDFVIPAGTAEYPDYDYAGYVAKYGVPNLAAGEHLTDEFKLPSHITFSSDSIYSVGQYQGGNWVGDETTNIWVFYPSDYNLTQHTEAEFADYFVNVEYAGTSTTINNHTYEGTLDDGDLPKPTNVYQQKRFLGATIHGTKVTFDRSLTLASGTYTFYCYDTSGNEISKIISGGVTLSELIVAGEYNILNNSIFVISGANEGKIYKVISIDKSEESIYSVSALEHSEELFDYVNGDITLVPKTGDFNDVTKFFTSPVESISVQENFGTNGIYTQGRLQVSWVWGVATTQSYKANFKVSYSVDDDNPINLDIVSSDTCDIINPIPGIYTITVWAINPYSGIYSTALTYSYAFRTEAAISTLKHPINVRITGTEAVNPQPETLTFDTPALSLSWDYNPENQSVLDALYDYLVVIYDETGLNKIKEYSVNLILGDKVLEPSDTLALYTPLNGSFELSFNENVNIFSGIPTRTFKVKIYSRDVIGDLSLPATVTVTNPVPVFTSFALTPDFGKVRVDIEASAEFDSNEYLIYRGTEATFTPTAENLYYKGLSNSVSLTTPDTEEYFYKCAISDSFGSENLNYSLAESASSIIGNADFVTISGEQFFTYAAGITTPRNPSITLTATLHGTLTLYSWQYWNGSTWTSLSGTVTDQTYILYPNNTAWGNSKLLRIRCLSDTMAGEISIVKVSDGADGIPGFTTATVYIYKRLAGTNPPALPTTTTTYTFSSAVLTGLNNGWTTYIPAGTDPLYVSAASASAGTPTDTIASNEWATPVVLAKNGADGTPGVPGVNTATIYLYKTTTTSTPPDLPNALVTYTFSNGTTTGITNNWVRSLPTTGTYRWVTTATALGTGTTDTIASSEWAAVSLLAKDGTNAAYVIVNGEQAFKFPAGQTTPVSSTITLTAALFGGLTTYLWQYWSGTAWTNLGGVNSNQSYDLAYDNSVFTGASLRIRCLSGTSYDEITVLKLYDGINGKDSITGYLTNETAVLPADANGVVSDYSLASGNFKVFKGTTPILTSTYSVSEPSSAGLVCTIDAGYYSVTGTMNADVAKFSLNATYDNVTLNKVLTLTRVKPGANGTKGESGVPGKAAVRAYQVTSDAGSSPSYLSTTANGSLPGLSWSSTQGGVTANKFQWQIDGIADYSTGTTIWTEPYLSLFKVDTLEAFTLKTGTLRSNTSSGQKLVINEKDGITDSNEIRIYSSTGALTAAVGDTGTGTWESLYYANLTASTSITRSQTYSIGLDVLFPPKLATLPAGQFLTGVSVASRTSATDLTLDGCLRAEIGIMGRPTGAGNGIAGTFSCFSGSQRNPTTNAYKGINLGYLNSEGEAAAKFDWEDSLASRNVILCDASYAINASGNMYISGDIRAGGNVTAYYSSDRNLKENIIPILNPLDKLSKISGNTFKWKDSFYDSQDKTLVKQQDIGVIAQEIQEVIPEAVHQREDGTLAVAYEKIIPLLIEAIKAQQEQIEELKKWL